MWSSPKRGPTACAAACTPCRKCARRKYALPAGSATSRAWRLAPKSVAANSNSPSREFDLQPADNLRLANLCGPLDENLRQLESRLDVQIRRRGGNFRVVGTRAAQAEDTLRELFDLADDDEVTPERV